MHLLLHAFVVVGVHHGDDKDVGVPCEFFVGVVSRREPIGEFNSAVWKLLESACCCFVGALVSKGVVSSSDALDDVFVRGVPLCLRSFDRVVAFAAYALEQKFVEVAVLLKTPWSFEVVLAV